MTVALKVFGLLAQDAYDPGKLGYPIFDVRLAPGGWNGFQAVAYMLSGGLVIAFRGTELKKNSAKGDGLADLALGVGANSAYFAAGERFVTEMQQSKTVVAVCGHSLGGAIAQVVANRMDLPMVTFNAPGVGVIASRNLAQADPRATLVRIGGMLTSAAVYPGQAIRDVKAAFRSVRGLNIRLSADPVSMIGVHYGDVQTLPFTSLGELISNGHIDASLGPIDRRMAAHGIDTVNKVLNV